jgi:hypothetical protein
MAARFFEKLVTFTFDVVAINVAFRDRHLAAL